MKKPSKLAAEETKRLINDSSAVGVAVHCTFTRLVDVAALQPNPRNPKKHPDKQTALLRHYGNGAFTTSVWSVDKPRESKLHPTMKPVELYVNAYLNSTPAGALVYEPFSGSGTAIIASESTGRKCAAIDIDPKYVAVAIQRWADATGKEPKLLNG
jgi:DNA modification methylase